MALRRSAVSVQWASHRRLATAVDPPPIAAPSPSRPSPALIQPGVRTDSLASKLWRDHQHLQSAHSLEEQASRLHGHPLGAEVAYESTPAAHRRVKCETAAAGILRIAYVTQNGLVECAGFAVQTSNGPVLLTCLHTLAQTRPLRQDAADPVVSLLFLPDGTVQPLPRIRSVLRDVDLLFFELEHASGITTLPINPYPPQPDSPISLFLPAGLDNDRPARWITGHVQSYRDEIGREAAVGTYDELSEMLITCLPEPGASGGPVIDSHGSVVGIVRGWRTAWSERTTAGFACPSQHIFEVADLPGLPQRR